MKRLIAEITTGAWMIEPSYAWGYAQLIEAILKGDEAIVKSFFQANNSQDKKTILKHEVYVVTPEGSTIFTTRVEGRNSNPFDEAPSGSVAIIPVSGPIMKRDYCGDAGTATRAKQAKEADAHPNIAGHVFVIDSGGGSVDGTQYFADVIASLKKPAIAFVDGLAASAAYWIASATKKVILSSATSMAGSIGTMVSFRDYAAYMAKNGVKSHEIYATESTDKNKAYRDALEDNYKTIRSEILDPLNEQFIGSVKKNREGKFDIKKENVFSGKVYVGQAAISAGLADSFGTLEEAIQEVVQLAAQTNPHNYNNSQMKVRFLSGLLAVAAFFGFKAADGADHVEGEVSAEQWADLNARLEEVNQLKGDNATLATQLKAALETNQANANIIKDHTAKITELQALIEGKPSALKTDKTDEITTQKNEAQETIDSLPHNKALEGNPLFN